MTLEFRPSCLQPEIIIINAVETEQLVLACKLWFAGEVDFTTEWLRNGSVVETEMVHTLFGRDQNSAFINSTLSQQVNSSDNGAVFIFMTTFRQGNKSRETVVIRNFTVIVLCE